MDTGTEIAILYHFWLGKTFFVVRTTVPKSLPKLASIIPSIPAATLYEAEVHDLLGVTFVGNPFMKSKLLLPDEYPKDAPPPLWKEADPAKIRRMMGLE
jgi:Ni,Fe-hydrogenase III component G